MDIPAIDIDAVPLLDTNVGLFGSFAGDSTLDPQPPSTSGRKTKAYPAMRGISAASHRRSTQTSADGLTRRC